MGTQKTFSDMVDASGYWFTCCAIGRNSTMKAIKDRCCVIIFYGTGRKALADSPPAVYLFQDAAVLQVSRTSSAVVKRSQLEIC